MNLSIVNFNERKLKMTAFFPPDGEYDDKPKRKKNSEDIIFLIFGIVIVWGSIICAGAIFYYVAKAISQGKI